MDSETVFHRQLSGATELLEGLSIGHVANQEKSKLQDTLLASRNLHNDHQNQEKDKAKFNNLIQKAKEVGRQGQLEEALKLFEKAYDIHQSVKLHKRIQTLKKAIETYKEEEEDNEDEEDDGMREVGDGFSIPAEIHQALYPYQLEGLLWFWRLYQRKKGGILGDDMGLGKTIQVISFLAGMFDAELIKSVLIVMPVSLMPNWEKEFSKWAPGIRVKTFHGSNKKERMRNLEKIQRRTGVCLTTYGLIVSSHEALGTSSSGGTFTWDYIILDEGHKIKNTTKTSKNIREIPAKYHFILTGTPIQNNLREMWALFDFACEGQLLGTSRTFKQEYEGPIVRARERDASAYEKRIGKEMSESLRKLIEPYFLRRTKAMVLEKKKQIVDGIDGAEENKENQPQNPVRAPGRLTRKNDFIVWLFMSPTQLQIYRDFLGLERVKEMLMSTKSPLAELNVLKKICDHPRLLSPLACEQLGLDDEARLVEMDSGEELLFAKQPKGLGPSDKVLIQESGKMVFLIALLENLKSEGHRCLIFSQSRKMLDIIQRVLSHMGHKILRIDGTITSTAERQHLINTFQTDSAYSCFLLTTQVGGVGITLTAADRVVIFDPSWNPATDAQAVDRVYRIGQKKTVVIYRLITCGTLEEKIYRKQIFKDALMKQTTGVSKNPFRYFSRQDLRDLFTLDAPHTSKTQLQLASMHAHHRKTDEQLDKHISFLHTLDIFGITDHDLMYSQEDVETPEEMDGFSGHDAIQARVLRAQNLMAAEAGITSGGAYTPRPVPATCPRPPRTTPAPPESVAFPRGLHESLSLNNLTARQKIQATIDNERFIEPKRQDTKRFQPSQFIQNVSSNPSPASPVVVDLTSCAQSPSVPSPVEIHSDSLVELTATDEQKQGEDLGREFESLHIEHSEIAYEHVPSPCSAPRVSPQEKICPEASVHSPIANQYENIVAEKKASRRRKSMSQRLELPEMDDSDDEDSSLEPGKGPEIEVNPDSRGNSVVEQDDTIEESTSSINNEVELDSEEVVIGQSFDKDAEGSDDELAHGSDSVSSPEPMMGSPSRAIDDQIPSSPDHIARAPRVVCVDDEIKSISEISQEEKRNDSMVDWSHQDGEGQIAIITEESQISDEETEDSGDEENAYETGSQSSPETVMDPSSRNTDSATHSSSEYQTRVRRISDDEDETLQQKNIRGAERNSTSEYGQVNDIEISPHTRRDIDNGYYDSTDLMIRQKVERFDDRKIEEHQSGSDSENEADDESITERLSDTSSPQTGYFLGDVENHHARNATGSSSETGSQLSSLADSDESQSRSSSSRGEFDEASPERHRAIRPRVRRIVSSGDEDEEEGDGEYAVQSAERRCKDLDLSYNRQENKSAEAKSQERSSLSFQSRYERSPSSMVENNSLSKEIVPCPTGQHVSDVIEIHKCACVASETERSKYLLYIDNGRKLELEGNLAGACAQYLAALGLMDSDFELHKKILELAKIMDLPS